MEDEQRKESAAEPPVRPVPWLEWWFENFTLVRDLFTRRYAVHVQSYDGLLRDPESVIRRVLAWIDDPDADVEAAVAAVRPEHRTQERPEVPEVDPGVAEALDFLHDTVDSGAGLDRGVIERLNRTNERLAPLIEQDRKRVLEARQKRRQGRPASPGA
jgi:hypothetical protein